MKFKVQTITGAEITVWRSGTLFHAAATGAPTDTQVCVAADLFEVMAELAGLDLERSDQAREAIELAGQARSEPVRA